LLAIIEAGFGDFALFDRIVRRMLCGALTRAGLSTVLTNPSASEPLVTALARRSESSATLETDRNGGGGSTNLNVLCAGLV
jgi:hypothetical protein